MPEPLPARLVRTARGKRASPLRPGNPEGARFCNACAAPLAVDKDTRLEERKAVPVLFADLVGFTSRAERMDPEKVRSLLRPRSDPCQITQTASDRR